MLAVSTHTSFTFPHVVQPYYNAQGSLTLGIQQLGQSQLFLSHVKGILQVIMSIGALQVVKLNQVRSVGGEKEGKMPH